MKFFQIFFLQMNLLANSNFFDIFQTQEQIDYFLKSGSQFGYFTNNEFWTWFENVRNDSQNQQYLSPKNKIGQSFEKRDIYSFYISDNSSKLSQEIKQKNLILFTALHHSREPLTLTMVILMIIEILQQLREKKHNRFHELLRDNIIAFIPVVNVDSYILINENWNNKGVKDDDILMIRKNRNVDPSCDIFSGGTDLNRNYQFKFGLDEVGSSSNPCSEDFRGKFPFSEPETQTVKNFVEKHTNIISAVNIHSYGNDWIYPFNFVHDKQDLLMKTKSRIYFDFLQDFAKKVKQKEPKALFGNAASVLDYSTNGEAGDWLTGAKNILNIDVELGNEDERSNQFYPPKILIDKILRYNWITMKDFLYQHIIEFKLKKIEFNPNYKNVSYFIMNESLSGLYNFTALIKGLFINEQQKMQLQFCYKEYIEEKCTMNQIIKNNFISSFHGRYILELLVKFETNQDYQQFEGLVLEIERNEENYRNYPNQKYIFKNSVFKNKK